MLGKIKGTFFAGVTTSFAYLDHFGLSNVWSGLNSGFRYWIFKGFIRQALTPQPDGGSSVILANIGFRNSIVNQMNLDNMDYAYFGFCKSFILVILIYSLIMPAIGAAPVVMKQTHNSLIISYL